MSEHTKEPWKARDTLVLMGVNEGGFDLRDCPSPEANARRIVACVNACAGLDTDTLESTKLVDALNNACERTTKQRDDLLAELLKVARMAEALKRECGINPESPQAIRNGEYMNISYVARAAIAKVKPC